MQKYKVVGFSEKNKEKESRDCIASEAMFDYEIHESRLCPLVYSQLPDESSSRILFYSFHWLGTTLVGNFFFLFSFSFFVILYIFVKSLNISFDEI